MGANALQSPFPFYQIGAGSMGIQHKRKALRTAAKRKRKSTKHKTRSLKKSAK
jgi:hypothetical protein